MDYKRFYKGDLVATDIGGHNEIYGIIIDDDVFNDSSAKQYVKVRWTDGQITTNTVLGLVKVKEQ
tara:strand:+ start:75 stop:269 length:195 start_codon:yes stop_codon:yes gene_type:complete